MKVLKYCSQQYDHLIEFSPIIPETIIKQFKSTFKKFKELEVPSIIGKLRGTRIFTEELLVERPPTSNSSIEDIYATDMPVNISVLARSKPVLNHEESSSESSVFKKEDKISTKSATTTESCV